MKQFDCKDKHEKDDVSFGISLKMTIEKSSEPVITWLEDNTNRIFCIGRFMSRFKETLKECGIDVVNTKYDSTNFDGINYEINDKIFIRVSSKDQSSLFPINNNLHILFMEKIDTSCGSRNFVHSYYIIEFKKDEYIKCINEWHMSSSKHSKYVPELKEYKEIDEKLHIAVDKQISDFDKEIKIKNYRNLYGIGKDNK